MEITYTRIGEYLLPDIFLLESPKLDGYGEPLGKYARMRRVYLKEHRTILYNTLLLSEKLYPHLREIDEAARTRLDNIDDYEIANEIILSELVYN